MQSVLVRSVRYSLLVLFFGILHNSSAPAQETWRQHDLKRPRPPIVTPGAWHEMAPPPSDAVVLFDGTDLSRWQQPGGGATKWIVKHGAMMPTPDSGSIETRDKFGDVQLHIEFQTPTPTQGSGQGRGNSGVYLMSRYELQILDSFENETYADGQAAAIYGQNPPLANASLPPGTWQKYDIVFHAPRFDDSGSLKSPATMTVFHNGVLVQDHFELKGGTMWLQTLPYSKHEDRLPISLQDHGNPVRFRNIWARPLDSTPAPLVKAHEHRSFETPLEPFTGKFRTVDGVTFEVDMHDGNLRARLYDMFFDFRQTAENLFESTGTDLSLEYSNDQQSVRLSIMGEIREATRAD